MATPILTTAETEMANLIDGMTSSTYNLDWDNTNEEDLGRIDWAKQTALATIYWEGEENTDDEDGAHANAYANVVTYRIRITCLLDEPNPEFPRAAKRSRLRLALDDLKKLFGTSYNLESDQLFIMYQGTDQPEVNLGGEMLQGHLNTYWTVRYFQDRETPTQVAG